MDGRLTPETHSDGLEFEPANLAARRIRIILRIRRRTDIVPLGLAEVMCLPGTGILPASRYTRNADNVYYVR